MVESERARDIGCIRENRKRRQDRTGQDRTGQEAIDR